MSKKKGLSFEEKKQRMLQLLYEKKEVYQLKDLEKIAPKEKGIVSQSVKEVLQAIVDDGFVDTDKVGTSVYFWAFPSKALNIRKRKNEELTQKLEESRRKMKTLEEKGAQARVGREESEDRSKLLHNLKKLQEDKHALKEELKKFKECDPEMLEAVKKETVVAKDAANRWTDNIFTIKSWCVKKFMCKDSDLNKSFEISEELDYID